MSFEVVWRNDMLFEGVTPDGHRITMDTTKEHGGRDSAPAPMEMVLLALGGCTGMDVISILRKMKDLPREFYIEIESDRADEHPKVYKKTKMRYVFIGDVQEEHVRKAIELSQQKYCAVSAMLRSVGEVEYSYEIRKE